MTLQEFLSCCRELEAQRDHQSGMRVCDDLLALGPEGRLLAAGLRYRGLFMLQASQGNAAHAVGHLIAALEAVPDHPQDLPPIFVTLIAAYGMRGGCEQAQTYADEYFSLAGANTDPEIRKYIPKIWFNLGYAYDAAREYLRAVEAYSKSRESAIAMPDVFNQGLPAHNLVETYLALGRVDDAKAMLEEAKACLDHSLYGCLIRNHAAKCELAQGHLIEAEHLCEEALEHPSCDKRGRAEVYFTMAQLHETQHNPALSDLLAQRALEITRALPHPRLTHKVEGFLMALRNREEVPKS